MELMPHFESSRYEMHRIGRFPEMTKRNSLIPINEDAPDFTLPASDGGSVTLSSFRGKSSVVLVFYPGDNTPICRSQLCEIRDEWSFLLKKDLVAYGVNPASLESHAEFAKKNHLPFPLLTDAKGEVIENYGCSFFFGIMLRTVYVIDKAGKVAFAQRGKPSVAKILAKYSKI